MRRRAFAVLLAGLASAVAAKDGCGDLRPSPADGAVTVGDAVAVLRIAAGLEPQTALDVATADVAPGTVDELTLPPTLHPARDGVLTVGDAVQLLRVATGLVVIDGCGEPPTRLPRLFFGGSGCEGEIAWAGVENPDRQPIGELRVAGAPVTILVTDLHGTATWLGYSVPDFAAPADGIDVTVSLDGSPTTSTLRAFPACAAAPVIVGLTPATADPDAGDGLWLTGAHLRCIRSAELVGNVSGTRLDAVLARIDSDESIEVIAPACPAATGETWDLVVTTACGATVLPGAFRYVPTPLPDAQAIRDASTLLSQGPAYGRDRVEIDGVNLRAVDEIRIGGLALTRAHGDFDVVDDGAILIPSMPASPNGPFGTLPASVVVKAAGHADSSPLTWTWLAVPAPTCASVRPATGSVQGGTEIVVTGSGLLAVDAAWFADVTAGWFRAPSVQRVSDEELVVVTPPHPEGSVSVLLGDPAIGACVDAFEYVP